MRKKLNVGDRVYRFEDDSPLYVIDEYIVERLTAQRAILRLVDPENILPPTTRIVKPDAYLPFAYATKKEAAYAYLRRKERHRYFAEASFDRATSMLKKVAHDYNLEEQIEHLRTLIRWHEGTE